MDPTVAIAMIATKPTFLNICGGIKGWTLQKTPSGISQRELFGKGNTRLLTVDSKCRKCRDADEQSAEDFRARPGVRRPSPREAHEEQDAAGNVKEDADEIQVFRHFQPGFPVDMELVV